MNQNRNVFWPTRLKLSYARRVWQANRPELAYTDTLAFLGSAVRPRLPRPSAAPHLSSTQKKMGNDVAKNCANRMAIGAMSNVTDLERPVIQRMSEKLADIAKREGSKDLVTKEEFGEVFSEVDGTPASCALAYENG